MDALLILTHEHARAHVYHIHCTHVYVYVCACKYLKMSDLTDVRKDFRLFRQEVFAAVERVEFRRCEEAAHDCRPLKIQTPSP